ncbi:MAG: transporter substrate-binding domain-containing protein [Paracoccaceae bacterium]
MKIANCLKAALAAVTLSLLPAAATQAQEKSTWDQIFETKTLRLGCAQSEPWCFKDASGEEGPGAYKSGDTVWRGVSVQLGKSIADAMGVKLEVVETTWGNAVAGLQANQFDFMFVLDATPERALAIDFAGPILWYPVALLVPEDFKPTTWAEMNDPQYTFGAVTGTTFVRALEKYTPKANIVTFQQSSEVIAAFQAGRIMGSTGTGPNADVARTRLGVGKTLVPTPVQAYSTGAGIRKEADKRWRDYLQVAVTYYYDNGTTDGFYRDFLAWRGLDPETAVSTRREVLLR